MENEEIKDVFLCFVRLIGEENDGFYRYEFIFTDNPDETWGENWEQKPACLVNNLIPIDEYMTEVHIVKTDIKLDLIQNNCCFSMQDALDNVIAIAYENIDNYEDFPEEGRLVFMFGESFEDVERKLAIKNIIMM